MRNNEGFTKMIKMVATDIDGTIFKWDSNFTPAVKECVKKLTSQGIKVVLVTGRMHKATTFLADELCLETPIVSYQGGMIKENKTDAKPYYSMDLDPEYAKKIIKWGRENNVNLNLYMDDLLYVEKDDETIRKYTDARYIDYTVCNFDDLKLEKVNKILAIKYGDAEKVTEWVEYLSTEFPELYIVKSTPFFCEVSHTDARKSYAVEYLMKKWGLKKEEILTIGDQNNDIELLKAGGVKVAMGNATDELKACADYITDTVENDGFVKAMEKFINYSVNK